jgi:hypothetical protein
MVVDMTRKVDMSILAVFSRPRTIAGSKYQVVWNCEDHVAEILKDGELMDEQYTSEFAAHGYLNALASLNQSTNDWRSL